jgi:hypothetical protein
MKKVLLLLLLALPMCMFGQADNKAKQMTKFEEFSSATGKIVKFQDYKLPNMAESFMGSLETGIRTIMGGTSNAYFYRIEETETSRTVSHIAMIEYSDLVEINKALDKLCASVETDIAANPDYLENKFRTVDGFEVGYYINKAKASWFMKLERYTSSTVFVKNQETLVDAFKNAQAKIEELKSQNK